LRQKNAINGLRETFDYDMMDTMKSGFILKVKPGAACLACGGPLPEHESGVPNAYCRASCRRDFQKKMGPGKSSDILGSERAMMARIRVAPKAAPYDAREFFSAEIIAAKR
jgi:hypothetical protein